MVIPNKQIIGDMLVNHSLYGAVRVNVPVGIAFKERIAEARDVLLPAARSVAGVLETPAPQVVVSELGGSSVNLEVRRLDRRPGSRAATAVRGAGGEQDGAGLGGHRDSLPPPAADSGRRERPGLGQRGAAAAAPGTGRVMRRAVTRTASDTLTGATRLLNFHKRHPPAGAPPGTLVFPEERTPAIVRITVYGPEGVMERYDVPLEELPALILPDRVMWIDVQGLGDEAVLRRLAAIFDIHRLAMEDAVNVPQRPKAEAYERQHRQGTCSTRSGSGSAPARD